MKKFKHLFYALAVMVCMSFLTVACGGGSNPCEAAFLKAKACWAKKNCSDIQDASDKQDCENGQKYASYSLSVTACEESAGKNPLGGLISCKCEGFTKTAAELAVNCTLDESDCSCKQS